MRASITAILPGKFGNRETFLQEAAKRIVHIAIAIISAPLTIPAFFIGAALDVAADFLSKQPYQYLEGKIQEKNVIASSFTVFSANLCMLPFGISYFAGIRHPLERIEQAAKAICDVDADFVCLQEMSTPYAQALWDKISNQYAHGFTRIGPMPYTRMEGSLFFASKYPVEEVRYYPLTDIGFIKRGVVCCKTAAGWIVNTHLSQGKENGDLRKKQMEEIVSICDLLSEQGKIACSLFLDSNILRTGKDEDEYSKCTPLASFISGNIEEEPFVLSENNATCTNVIGFSIQGSPDPVSVEEAFESIDHSFVYKPSKHLLSMETKKLPGYDLDKREDALSDHHMLISHISIPI
jgi:hypothetical protein